MTVFQAFINFLEEQGCGVFGQNIYAYRVPNSKKTQTELYYLIPSGGSPVRRTSTGKAIKLYQILIYFRSNSAEKVDNTLNELEKLLNCAGCVELEGFELVDIQATSFPTDQDLDSENRMVGMIQCQLQVYDGCE